MAKTCCRTIMIISIFGATSCNDPVAQQRLLARQQAVVADIDSANFIEKQRPAAVAADLREVGVIMQENERKFRSNCGWYDYMLQKEVHEWNAQMGDRLRGVEQEFAGDPKRAHDTAVQFLD